VFDFFEGTGSPLKPKIIGEINAAHSPLADHLPNLISTAQHLSCLNGYLHVAFPLKVWNNRSKMATMRSEAVDFGVLPRADQTGLPKFQISAILYRNQAV
jgi:hypothetical protein